MRWPEVTRPKSLYIKTEFNLIEQKKSQIQAARIWVKKLDSSNLKVLDIKLELKSLNWIDTKDIWTQRFCYKTHMKLIVSETRKLGSKFLTKKSCKTHWI